MSMRSLAMISSFTSRMAGGKMVRISMPREAKEERVVIPSEPMQLARVESLILSRLEALNYGERALFAVRLALEEAVINAIKHGNRMDKARHVTITYSVDSRQCVIGVEDEGPGFDPKAVPDPTADENLEPGACLTTGRIDITDMGLILLRLQNRQRQ